MISKKLKIHDALLLKLLKAKKDGKFEGPITDIVGTTNIKCYLEELVFGYLKTWSEFIATETYEKGIDGLEDRMEVGYENIDEKIVEMCPDIIIETKGLSTPKVVAIEVETDNDYDFGRSLRQIKKYKNSYKIFFRSKKYETGFDYVHIIIPKIYEEFAPYYKSQGFRVWLWKGNRIWQCKECNENMENEYIISKFKCKDNKMHEHVLLGLDDETFSIEEY